jgi:tetratricopeptide (TPR) repeat protein
MKARRVKMHRTKTGQRIKAPASGTKASITELPDNIKIRIFNFVDKESPVKLGMVNKDFQRLSVQLGLPNFKERYNQIQKAKVSLDLDTTPKMREFERVEAYSSFIKALVSAEMNDRAESYSFILKAYCGLVEMSELMKSRVRLDLIDAFASVGITQEAKSLLEKATQDLEKLKRIFGINVSFEQVNLIKVMERTGMSDEAKDYLESYSCLEMPEDYKYEAQSILGLTKDYLEQAAKVDIERFNRFEVYCTLIKDLATHDMLKEAKQCITKAKEYLDAYTYLEMKEKSDNQLTLVKTMASHGQINEAEKYLYHSCSEIDEGEIADAFNALIKAMWRNKRTTEAEQYLEKAIKNLNAWPEPEMESKYVAQSDLVDTVVSSGMISQNTIQDQVIGYLEQTRTYLESDTCSVREDKFEAQITLFKAFASCGEIEKAKQCIAKSKALLGPNTDLERDKKAKAQSTLIKAMVSKGMIDDAKDYLDNSCSEMLAENKSEAQSTLIKAMVSKGMIGDAINYLESDSCSNMFPYHKALAHSELIIALSQAPGCNAPYDL